MRGILIKATGNNQTVPGNYTGMPEFPTMIQQFIFYLVGAICALLVSGVFINGGNEGIAMFYNRKPGRFSISLHRSQFLLLIDRLLQFDARWGAPPKTEK